MASEETEEVWRKCVSWLTEWDILPPDHKTNWPESTIDDLVSTLSDGVLLCKLLNKIEIGCIDMTKVILEPTSESVVCPENISLFLEICKSNFGLKESDLFRDAMLFNSTNMDRVLYTLSKLSLSKKSLKTGISGFSASMQEDDIYYFLEKFQPANIGPPLYKRYSCVFQELRRLQIELEKPKPEGTRACIINELLEFEKNYVIFLNSLRMNFFVPELQDEMGSEDHACLFYKIKDLYDIHTAFLIELRKIESDPNIKLSEIFLQFNDRFLIYGSYCANISRARNLLAQLLLENDNFKEILKECEIEMNNGEQKLGDMLLRPMARFLKYRFLLERLIKANNDQEHIDTGLPEAVNALKDLADYMEAVTKDSEHLDMLDILQNAIDGRNFDPFIGSKYGKLITWSEAKVKAPGGRIRDRYVIVFDKRIVICKRPVGNYTELCDILNLAEYRIIEPCNRVIINLQAFMMYKFLLVTRKNKMMTYKFYVSKLSRKNRLVASINAAKDNIKPKSLLETTHRFEFCTFPEPVKCGHCFKYLKGLLFQGYTCNCCGAFAHKDCLSFMKDCPRPDDLPDESVDLLNNQLWYVGLMDRDTAEEKMENRESGTFLVRKSPGKDHYSLTLKNGHQIVHLQIFTTQDDFLDQKKYYFMDIIFNSIEELILHFEKYSCWKRFDGQYYFKLEEDKKLLYPFRQFHAIAMEDHDPKDQCQLKLKRGQAITLIGKDGYREGYWRGRLQNNKIGYFPLKKIKLEEELYFD